MQTSLSYEHILKLVDETQRTSEVIEASIVREIEQKKENKVLTMLLAFLLGILVGIIVTYIVYRNSPKHFEEIKSKIDEISNKIKLDRSKNG